MIGGSADRIDEDRHGRYLITGGDAIARALLGKNTRIA